MKKAARKKASCTQLNISIPVWLDYKMSSSTVSKRQQVITAVCEKYGYKEPKK